MPSIQGFEITMERPDGSALTNYGSRPRSNTVHTHIEAKDGLKFQIRVKHDPGSEDSGGKSQPRSRYNLRSFVPDTKDAMSYTKAESKPKRPYVYFASVFIDGHYQDNVRIRDVSDGKPDGHIFEGRSSEVFAAKKSGLFTNLRILPWQFNEKGFDVLFNHMNIAKPDADIPKTEHDEEMAGLSEALAQDSSLDQNTSKRGQIEVIIQRKVQLKKIRRSSPVQDDEESDADDNNTHYVAVDRDNEKCVSVITWHTRPYRAEEDFWVKVVFHYHNLAKLVNLGLAHTDSTPVDNQLLRALPALPSTPESQNGVLKRLRGAEAEESEVKVLSDEDESASSDSSSDSDVPRTTKRRGAITFEGHESKPKRDTKKMLNWGARTAAGTSNEIQPPSLPEFRFEANEKVPNWLKLEFPDQNKDIGNQPLPATADAGTLNTNAGIGNMELAHVSDGLLEFSDDEEIG